MADRLVGPSFGVVRQCDIAAISRLCGARGVQVWATLTTYATGGEGGVWPHQATLAEICDCDERTVRRSIQDLTDHGYLMVAPMLQQGRKVGNKYTLVLPDVPDTHVLSDIPTERTPMSGTERTPMSVRKNKPQNKPLVSTTVEKAKADKRGTRVPDYDTLRSLMNDKDREEWNQTYPGRTRTELEQFIDHHTAKGTISKSWPASMRTWRRNGYGAKPKTQTAQILDEEAWRREEHLKAIREANGE